MQTQQHTGLKIKLLVKKKGLQLKWLADQSGWSEARLSRKINSTDVFESKKLAKISRALGISAEYLRDINRPYRLEDDIPDDAIIKALDQNPKDPLQDTISKLLEIQAQNMTHNQNVQILTKVETLTKSNETLIGIIKDLAEQVIDLKDERDGNHDPD